MSQFPASSECSHEKHDGPKILWLDHLHRVIHHTTTWAVVAQRYFTIARNARRRASALVSPRHTCRSHASKQPDELACRHSITSSARPNSVIGKERPSDFAVLRLMTNSVFVDCWTGRSAGLSPLTIRPV